MRSLEEFQTQGQSLFPEASSLPPFFENNLVDPARVVKFFHNDPQANIRVFYYQYLKLCFQLQSVDFQDYIHRIQTIINNEDFKFVFYEDDDPSLFSDHQFKQFLTQFFGILGEGHTTMEDAINKYAVMDTVLIYFFRAILILTGKAESLDSYLQREDLINFLCNYFNVEIAIHDKCIKFVQTDIFVYEEDPKEVYMAYMDYQKNGPSEPQVQASTGEDHVAPANNQTSFTKDDYVPVVDLNSNAHQTHHTNVSRRETSQINKSYISSQFMDYTHPSSLAGLVSPSKNLKESATMHKEPSNNIHNIYMSTKIEPSKDVSGSLTQALAESKPVSQSVNMHTDTFTYSSQTNSINSPTVPQHDIGYSSHGTYNTFTNPSLLNDIKQVASNWQPSKVTEPQNIKPLSTVSQTPKPSIPSYQPQSSQISYPKPSSTLDNYSIKPPSYTSIISESNKNILDTKPPSYHSKDQVPYQPYQPNNYNAALNMPSGKNPFNLNVSLEFTNSFTMKAMAEPFKTSVRGIRQRARNYRDSLSNFLK